MFREMFSTALSEALVAVDLAMQPENAWDILESLANVHAPSQTVPYTRAKVIKRVLDRLPNGTWRFDSHYAKTGTALLSLGSREPEILFFAHADECSYLVGNESDDHSWALVPYCSDRAEIDHKAVALRYNRSSRTLEPVAEV